MRRSQPCKEVGRNTPGRAKVGRGHVCLRSGKQPVWPGREIGDEAKGFKQGWVGYKKEMILSAKGTY